MLKILFEGLVECDFNEKFYYFKGLLIPTPYPSTQTLPTPCPTHPTHAPTAYPGEKSVVGSEREVLDIFEKGLNCEFEFEKKDLYVIFYCFYYFFLVFLEHELE